MKKKKNEYELDPCTHALVIKHRELSKVKLHGDKFSGRFLCQFFDIACFAKKLLIGENIIMYPSLKKGVSDSFILTHPVYYMGEDMSIVTPIVEKLREAFEPFRIGESLWEFTYSFEDFKEMIFKVFEVVNDYADVQKIFEDREKKEKHFRDLAKMMEETDI